MGQKFAAYDPDNGGVVVAFYDDADSPVPDGVHNVKQITDDQWQQMISSPGWSVQDNTLVAPVPPSAAQTKAANQDAQWTAIKAERDRRTQTGGYYVKSADKWFNSDSFSRTQQIGLVLYGSNMPDGIQWKTMDGSFVTMTPALALAVFQAAGVSDQTIFGYAEQVHAKVLAASDPMSVDVLAGWPKIFGE